MQVFFCIVYNTVLSSIHNYYYSGTSLFQIPLDYIIIIIIVIII